jgi:3-hydroxyacyl-CoA dehydrogenase
VGFEVNLGVALSFDVKGGEPERWRPSPIQAELVAAGRLGRKSGQGFYDYSDPPDPDAAVPSHRIARKGNGAPGETTLDAERLAAIDPAAPQILPRLVAQIANEAAFALEEEIGSPADMDTAMRLGFNWPRGPLELTELLGAARAVELLEDLRAGHGEAYQAAPSLVTPD